MFLPEPCAENSHAVPQANRQEENFRANSGFGLTTGGIMLTSEELRKRGGHWIAAARSWIQRTFMNGDTVTWGSDEVLRGDISPRKIEELAEVVVLAYANRDIPEQTDQARYEKEFELVLAVGHLEPTKAGRDLVPAAVAEIKRMREEREELLRLLEEARVFTTTLDKDQRLGLGHLRAGWANDLALKITTASSPKRPPRASDDADFKTS
jgi:hypothetical protein